jgi:hypothetical protein
LPKMHHGFLANAYKIRLKCNNLSAFFNPENSGSMGSKSSILATSGNRRSKNKPHHLTGQTAKSGTITAHWRRQVVCDRNLSVQRQSVPSGAPEQGAPEHLIPPAKVFEVARCFVVAVRRHSQLDFLRLAPKFHHPGLGGRRGWPTCSSAV